MRMKSMHLHLSFHFLCWVLSFHLSSGFVPSDDYLIDCGSPTDSTFESRLFSRDYIRANGFVRPPSANLFAKSSQPYSASPQIYHTARIFEYPSSYEFEIQKKGTHMIRLRFFPFVSLKSGFNLSSAVFSVHANGFYLLNDFTVSDGSQVVKEYLVAVKTSRLVLCFLPSKDSSIAFVNAIEVISMPDFLVPEAVHMDGKINYDSSLSTQALESIYRINMGGPKITPSNDTLFRTWIPDDGYLTTRSAAQEKNFGGPIHYPPLLPKEIAPYRVYDTAQVLRVDGGTNITWTFPLDLGYKYLVRFHFCDIVSLAVGELCFNVYINGLCAYAELDLSMNTHEALATPFYADFIVAPDSRGELSVSVAALDGHMMKKGALLNGLEIWKLNNSMASLDGEPTSTQYLRMDGSGRKFHAAIESLGAIILIAMAIFPVVVVLLKRKRARNEIGWTRLTVEADKV